MYSTESDEMKCDRIAKNVASLTLCFAKDMIHSNPHLFFF